MRAEKKLIVEELSRQISGSPFLILTDYSKMTVTEFTELRKKLRAARAECHVVKNTMLRRAAQQAGLTGLNGGLSGMTAVVSGGANADISAVAKILKGFSRATEKGRIKLGVMGQQILPPSQVDEVAELPSLETLRSGLIGMLQAPATRLAVVLGVPASQIARVVKARADKQAVAPPAAA